MLSHMCARLAAAFAVAAVVLAAPQAQAASASRPMQVSVRVVRSISVRTPDSLTVPQAGLRASGDVTGPGQAAGFAVSGGAGGGTAMAAFVGARGETALPCSNGTCQPDLSRPGAAAVRERALVLTLLPDGAPAGIVER